MLENVLFMSLSRIKISEYMNQRGTDKEIPLREAIVYDFMPYVIGERFRKEKVLLNRVFFDAPVDAPFILKSVAYETLGLIYLNKKDLIPALDCYRIFLDSRLNFVKVMSRIQNNALLNSSEKNALKFESVLEEKLVREVLNLNVKADLEAYSYWVEALRKDRKSLAKDESTEEILDTKWLEQFIDENFPESTFGGGW